MELSAPVVPNSPKGTSIPAACTLLSLHSSIPPAIPPTSRPSGRPLDFHPSSSSATPRTSSCSMSRLVAGATVPSNSDTDDRSQSQGLESDSARHIRHRTPPISPPLSVISTPDEMHSKTVKKKGADEISSDLLVDRVRESTPTASTSATTPPPNSSSSGSSLRRPSFWQTVLSNETETTTTVATKTTFTTNTSTASSEAAATTQQPKLKQQHQRRNDNAAINQQHMNIPCLVCGVRFRKPGHLNMHWRSVHARQHPHGQMTSTSAYSAPASSTIMYQQHQGPQTSSHSINSLMGPAATSSYSHAHHMNHPHSLHTQMQPPLYSSSSPPATATMTTTTATGTTATTTVGRRSYGGGGTSGGQISKMTRAYACPQCDASFRRGSDRNRHMRMVHAKIRPFECTICGNHFGRKSFLEAHVQTVHQKLRPFRCDCGAAFGQRSSLTRHCRKIHGREPS